MPVPSKMQTHTLLLVSPCPCPPVPLHPIYPFFSLLLCSLFLFLLLSRPPRCHPCVSFCSSSARVLSVPPFLALSLFSV